MTIKLSSIVRDDDLQNPKLADEAFPDEVCILPSVITTKGSTSTHFVK